MQFLAPKSSEFAVVCGGWGGLLFFVFIKRSHWSEVTVFSVGSKSDEYKIRPPTEEI